MTPNTHQSRVAEWAELVDAPVPDATADEEQATPTDIEQRVR